MKPLPSLRALLLPGNRRTVGKVSAVVTAVSKRPELIASLVECAFDEEAAVRMRAADALEKLSRTQSELLQPYASALLDLFERSEQQETRWHLAVLLPRLRLRKAERSRTAHVLQLCLNSKSSIVKVTALQGLADLIEQEPSLRPFAVNLLISAEESGTPAMKARSRKLLQKLRAQNVES